jgi:hypothetical protein
MNGRSWNSEKMGYCDVAPENLYNGVTQATHRMMYTVNVMKRWAIC